MEGRFDEFVELGRGLIAVGTDPILVWLIVTREISRVIVGKVLFLCTRYNFSSCVSKILYQRIFLLGGQERYLLAIFRYRSPSIIWSSEPPSYKLLL